MGRMMPLECEHGHYIDGGDFISDEDVTPCPECEAATRTLLGRLTILRLALRDLAHALRVAIRR